MGGGGTEHRDTEKKKKIGKCYSTTKKSLNTATLQHREETRCHTKTTTLYVQV